MTVETRLDDLESRLAFQDRHIETMSERVIAQQRQIDALEQRVEVLLQRLHELADNRSDNAPQDEKPPHY